MVLSSGVSRHIAFSAVSGGGSVFYTDDPDMQKSIESHYKFGKLFRIDREYEDKLKKKTGHDKLTGAEEDTLNPVKDQVPEDGDDGTGLKKIVVSDPDSAKSYLAEHCGISRTKLKSLKSIKEAAENNGIVFEGI